MKNLFQHLGINLYLAFVERKWKKIIFEKWLLPKNLILRIYFCILPQDKKMKILFIILFTK